MGKYCCLRWQLRHVVSANLLSGLVEKSTSFLELSRQQRDGPGQHLYAWAMHKLAGNNNHGSHSMNAGGFMHHDDLVAFEWSLRDVAARFGQALKILEIGIWSGDTSRSARKVLLTTAAAAYEHWTVDSAIHENTPQVPPFVGCNCVWADSIEAAPRVPEGLGLILVDGCHCLYHVLADFALYAPKLLPGGLMLFHDVNPAAQGTQYQYHGDPARVESHLSVNRVLDVLGLMPLVRRGWEVAHVGGMGGTWWGGLLAFRKVNPW